MADENEFGNPGSHSALKASDVTSNLKSVGIDPDRMTEAVADRAGELQRMLMEEVRAQPLRALVWAAAAGVVMGFWAAR